MGKVRMKARWKFQENRFDRFNPLPRREIGKNLLVSSSSAVQLFILVTRVNQGGMG